MASERLTLWQWLRRTLPTAGVCGIVGLAVWGNTTDWTMPKFSALIGAEKTEEADWCDEHNVPGVDVRGVQSEVARAATWIMVGARCTA